MLWMLFIIIFRTKSHLSPVAPLHGCSFAPEILHLLRNKSTKYLLSFHSILWFLRLDTFAMTESPRLIEDIICYRIYSTKSQSEDHVVIMRDACMEAALRIIGPYIWHRDPFQLFVRELSLDQGKINQQLRPKKLNLLISFFLFES